MNRWLRLFNRQGGRGQHRRSAPRLILIINYEEFGEVRIITGKEKKIKRLTIQPPTIYLQVHEVPFQFSFSALWRVFLFHKCIWQVGFY